MEQQVLSKPYLNNLRAIWSYVSLALAIYLSCKNILIALFFAHWMLSLLPHTFFHHRVASHSQYKMNKLTEKFMYLFSYLLQGPSYLSVVAYAILHRLHHMFADTEKDPHSPTSSPHLLSMMMKTRIIYRSISGYLYGRNAKIRNMHLAVLKRYKITKEDLEAANQQYIPRWNWFDAWGDSIYSRIIWAGLYGWFYFGVLLPWGGYSLWWTPLFVAHLLMAPLQGVIINWYAHLYGDRDYELPNTSRNAYWGIDWWMLGERFHNTHHKNSLWRNFAHHNKHYIDPTYWVGKLLVWSRIVW